MERITDDDLAVAVAGPVGFGNNIYIVIDTVTNEAAFIDAPAEPEASIAAAAAVGVRPSRILLTHGHGDHTAGIARLKQEFGCLLYACPVETGLPPAGADAAVHHGDEIRVGNLVFRALHVPGHTPGSTTYVCGTHAFVGDTLFPGGPGRTASNANLQQEIESIRAHLFTLPGETVIYPGHGDRSTIAACAAEYKVFASRPHDPNLHGDVTWEGS